MSQESANHDLKLLEDAAKKLGEHFDSVQIFATRHEPTIEDGTITVSYGVGNWFARYGQIKEWLIKSDERTRQAVRDENSDE